MRSLPATDQSLFDLLTGSFSRVVGRTLAGLEKGPEWLYRDAPYVLLAHGLEADPRFFYANRTAQKLFGYDWAEFRTLPSRLSALPGYREERQRLMDAVTRDGFVADFDGVRVTKSGQLFRIEHAVMWQLLDAEGRLYGQAATFEAPTRFIER
jgi:PAS domain-containing protein